MNPKYYPIIGMEIHVELRTKSKMFCGCPADHFNTTPNSQTCPVCLGLPGALPIPNREAINRTQLIGAAFNCKLAEFSKFDRKHYFYPDLSKGYQISQYDQPLCQGGVVISPLSTVNLTRIHLEEDTGKLQHTELDGSSVSLVDFNRSGVPLVEIVSEPELHSAAEAKAYAKTIRQVISFLGVSDCDMEKGSMRLEANISLATNPPDHPQFQLPAYKVEVKNINSFRFLERAIEYEISRQAEILDSGSIPVQETRGFNEIKMKTVSQRSKEEAKDYRYFPEPDIPPMVFTRKELLQIKNGLPLLPSNYLDIFTQKFLIRPDFALKLAETLSLAEKALACFELKPALAVKVANFLINKKGESESMDPQAIIAHFNLSETAPRLSSESLAEIIKESIAANSELVSKYKAGKTNVIGAFVGDIMRRSKGAADPKTINQLLIKLLK